MSADDGGFLREAMFNGNGVAKKLIVALVLFSALITTLTTALELWLEYRKDIGQIDRSLAFIGESYRPTLTDSVWVADREQVQTQIDGLLRLPDIEFVGIIVDGQPRWSAGQVRSQRVITSSVPLIREHRGQPLTIGTVKAVASVDRVLSRLWGRLLTILVANGVKTLLVATFLLLVFQYLVTRHLTRIAAFLRRIDPVSPSGERLELDRSKRGPWRPDILDAVADSVNALSRSLSDANIELRRSEQRLRALTRETTAYIYEIDRDGRIVFANRTRGGVLRERDEGSMLIDCFPPDLQPRIRQALQQVFEATQSVPLEFTLPDPAGVMRAYVTAITPMQHDGRVESATLTALDVSALKAAEQAVREMNASLEARVGERTAQLEQAVQRAESASRAKSEFLSRMSHELRTPMNAILGFAQIIEMSAPSQQQLRWVTEIRRAGSHLLELIEELLDLARIEVGKLAIHVEPLDVEPIVAEASTIVKPLAATHRVSLFLEPGLGAAGKVLSDRLRLRQVLVNLLSNAVKYNRAQGSVTVRCSPSGDRLRLSVSDSGIGIAAESIETLFQPFERLGAEAGPIEGTGIGLALCMQLAELMGATMGVESERGVGSTFWIDLRRADGLQPSTRDEAPAPASLPTSPCQLLYIEDNETNIAVVEGFLAPLQHIVFRSAADGESGLRLAAASRPDIVLLDIQLPGIDGYEVARRMRADPALSGIAIIAVSAHAMPRDIGRGIDAGFDRYLAKPLDRNELLAAIREVMALRATRPTSA